MLSLQSIVKHRFDVDLEFILGLKYDVLGVFDRMENRLKMNRRVSDRPAVYRRGGLTGPQVGTCQPQHRPSRAFTFGLVTGSD